MNILLILKLEKHGYSGVYSNSELTFTTDKIDDALREIGELNRVVTKK